MAFVVEDGTGLANSNSYVTVQEYRDYYTDRGIDKSSETDVQIEGYLVQSTEFIDLMYTFCGEKLVSTQALEFPRVIDEVDVGVPTRVKYATIIMGDTVSTTTGSIYTDPNQNIKQNKEKVGPIETDITYFTGSQNQSQQLENRYPEVYKYLEPYMCTSGLSSSQRRVISG